MPSHRQDSFSFNRKDLPFPLKVQLFLFKDVWGEFDPPLGKASLGRGQPGPR